MAEMVRWDPFLHRYFDYEPPVKNGNYTQWDDDMDMIIHCPQCGKQLRFGDGYTSKEIYEGTLKMFAFSVCTDCYNEELERWLLARKQQKHRWDEGRQIEGIDYPRGEVNHEDNRQEEEL